MREEEIVSLILPSNSSTPKVPEDKNSLTQGRNLEAGAEAEAMEECCLLACSPWSAQPAFIQHPECGGVQGLHCPTCAAPSHITN